MIGAWLTSGPNRLLSATCCGQNGNLTNPIVIPPGVPIPYDIPLPAGYTPNINITIPIPGTYDPNIVFGNGGTTTTSSTTPGGGPTGTPTSSGSSPTGTGGGGGGGGRNNGGCKDYPPGTSLQFFGANIPLPRPISKSRILWISFMQARRLLTSTSQPFLEAGATLDQTL